MSIISLSVHLDVEFSKSGQKGCDILIGLAQLLLILGVLGLVRAELLVTLQLDSFVLRHQFLHL